MQQTNQTEVFFITLLPLLFIGLGILAFVFWLWMLIDCIKNNRLDSTQKIVWVLVLIFLNGLGALIYFFAGRRGT